MNAIPLTSHAVAWHAQWVIAPGRRVTIPFPTQEQAELFALRHRETVHVVPVAGPAEPPPLAVVPEPAEVDADRFEEIVAGAPVRDADERCLLDVVAGLRRLPIPAVPARVSAGLRDRLMAIAS